jgi:1,2-diacylglycerol 3-alpha-glucosyltransferase
MKIAIFTDSYKPNVDGVATVTNVLAKEMTKKGHKIVIVCPGNNTETVLQDGFKIIRIKSYSIKLTELMKMCFKNPSYVENLEDFSKYDLIHVQSPATMGSLGILIALKHNIPVSSTFHTNVADFAITFIDDNVLQHESSNPFYKALLNSKIARNALAQVIKNSGWKMISSFYMSIPSSTVPARFCKTLLRNKGVNNDLFVINNPVNPTVSKKDYSKKYNIKGKYPIIHVGRISSEKRIEVFIQTIAKIKKEIPNILGIVCSDGLLKSDMEKLAKKLKVYDNMLFTGFIKRDELSWLYEQSKAVTAFGLYETFNLCAAEGLFYGKPLILTNSGPHPELINDNGYLINPGDNEAQDFAQKIKLLHDNPKLAAKLGANSKKHWKNYNYASTIAAHERFFEESSKKNFITSKNYLKFINYLAILGILMNTFLLTMSLKEKKDNGLIDEFDKFRESMGIEAKKLKKSF